MISVAWPLQFIAVLVIHFVVVFISDLIWILFTIRFFFILRLYVIKRIINQKLHPKNIIWITSYDIYRCMMVCTFHFIAFHLFRTSFEILKASKTAQGTRDLLKRTARKWFTLVIMIYTIFLVAISFLFIQMARTGKSSLKI